MLNETVLFADSTEDWLSKYNTGGDATYDMNNMSGLSLQDFFKRPVLIGTYEWKVGTVLDYTFNPWTLFINNARVSNRLSNYTLMNGSLHLKCVIDGSPFYYGKAILSYLPLHTYDTTTVATHRTTSTQRLHGYLNPTTCTGCEMILPYLWYYDHVNLPRGDFNNMGTCNLYGFNSLHFANGVAPVTVPINIQIYAWSDDMQVSCVTSQDISGLVAQSGEYSTSPVSNLATSVAHAAGKLENVPYIGTYAKATNMIATGIGAIAKSLGYSSPPVIDNLIDNHLMILGGISNVDRGDNTMKLTVDSKQELSIDPRTVGLDGEDQLIIKSIASRESFLTSFIWLPTDATGAFKWNARVRPSYSVYVPTKYYLPACTFASLPFQYWRGSMRFRFEVICTPFHRGRLKVVYDPVYITGAEANVNYTRIIDIGKETEFTIDIGWANAQKFLTMLGPSTTNTGFSTTAYTTDELLFSNGVIAIYVLNQLTSSNLDTSVGVDVNVFVSMTDDCMFGAPVDTYFSRMTALVPQAGSIDIMVQEDTSKPIDNTVNDIVCEPVNTVDHTMDVFFGETITSFRQLLHRYNYHMSMILPSVAVATTYRVRTCNFPLYRGITYRPAHIDRNNVRTTLLNYLAPAFLLHKGAIRSKYMSECIGTNDISYMMASNDTAPHATLTITATALNTTSDLLLFNSMTNYNYTANGAHVTEHTHQPNLEVEHPYYRAARVSTNKDPHMASGDNSGGWGTHNISVLKKGLSSVTLLHRLVAVGEDFSLFLFQGSPPLYYT